MTLADRQRALDALLAEFRPLWHAQPFREHRPDWCRQWPALAAELLALDDSELAHLADDGEAAAEFVARHVGDLAAMTDLARVPDCSRTLLPDFGPFWAYGIPGRNRSQIEAFAASAAYSGQPLIDWCGGKGHLGR
ncbi:MAG: methyltransferase, partial [Azonexus sp.]